MSQFFLKRLKKRVESRTKGSSSIVIKGARAHNLRNINVSIPHNTFTVITGVSGSGKSSIAFDTLYAEGQRRYVESLSTYARQFLGQMDKADVDSIEGLSPAIAIEQRTTQRNPRSTVGTVTEIHDHMRLLWARVGIPHCPDCGREVMAMPIERITDSILTLTQNNKVIILAPIASGKKGTFKLELDTLLRQGFVRIKIDGKIVTIDEKTELEKNIRHDIDVVVDRILSIEDNRSRIHEAVEIATKLANGIVAVELESSETSRQVYSEKNACPDCGIGFEPLDPKHFSFNSPHGACSECSGLGVRFEIDSEKVIRDPALSIIDGAIAAWGENAEEKWYGKALKVVSKTEKVDLNKPWKNLPKHFQEIVLYGSGERRYKVPWISQRIKAEINTKFEGVIPNLVRRYKETKSTYIREWIEGFMSMKICQACRGERLKPESRAVTVDGVRLPELLSKTVGEIDSWLDSLKLDSTKMRIADRLIDELKNRLNFLKEVGLDYLTLDRNAATLSGGEAQRIRLATQLGSRLRGVLYVLDEPSIGLHPADTESLLNTLKDLRDLGNTVVVVEHDRDTIEAADYVIDMGPGAGKHGGMIIAEGTPSEITADSNSLTGAYLSGRRRIEHDRLPRDSRASVRISGVKTNNLKNISVSFPLGHLICITGVSGSGKSSLVMDTLVPVIRRKLGLSSDKPGPFEKIEGIENIDKIICIDQSPIGRSSRSNPATYTGVFTVIRELFSMTKEARERGYLPGRFSFNVKGGRCEECAGDGVKTVEMHFLPDVYVLCEACKGKRYNRETLEVKYKGLSISDVLNMSIEDAAEFFSNIPQAKKWLNMLCEVGLGYLQLGQSSTTLSGGEAQRLKLASELGKTSSGRSLYVMDEPTTGLHFDDVRILIRVLDRFVDRGDTVIVVEHHPDIMAHSDTIIDLGPGSGDKGGMVVAIGSPHDIALNKESLTGQVMMKYFNGSYRL
ncbi:TPA: excinuclease ABC subunit UvrA [bacterium]|nr:excinuclease ABC subunit UvrA [bacterium]